MRTGERENKSTRAIARETDTQTQTDRQTDRQSELCPSSFDKIVVE